MHVHELRNAEGVVQAFEVSSLIGRRAACKIAASIPGVRVTKTHTPFVSKEVAFCEFELNGEQFLIEEPFQDNSRYWVGPKHNLAAGSLPLVLNHFANSKSGTRALYAGAAVVLAILVAVAYTLGARFVKQDRCLDAGGLWNSNNGTCEGARRDG
jgi:hypothetical protein